MIATTGQSFITRAWISERLCHSEDWVRRNWNKTTEECYTQFGSGRPQVLLTHSRHAPIPIPNNPIPILESESNGIGWNWNWNRMELVGIGIGIEWNRPIIGIGIEWDCLELELV
ncbi:unnamed protein product, partial [Adineta ricciae]